MRTRQEIALALDLLDEYGNEYKNAQANVLHDRMTESQVFDTYVANYPGDQRNEALYFAVRDAAQYVSGKLTLQELIPNLPDGTLEELARQKEEYEAEETVTVTLKDFHALVRRIDELEAQINALKGVKGKTLPESGEKDYMNQLEAARYIGCARCTLKDWHQKGLVAGHKQNGHTVYSRKELNASNTVKSYRRKVQRNRKP